ncbi:glyoxalase [Oceaniferula spumae]|uniref:Glyoxalase n=1 Tax=Oceaniferula spumae TaxID=2979115 RepID=A0AAT9FGJ1_9BACT
MKEHHDHINYVEFAATDLPATKEFFAQVFGWQFEDYGPEYTAFSNAGLNGGFYQADLKSSTQNGGALVVLYSSDLEATLKKVRDARGKITKETFSFPGGRRFQFTEPSGNELAVWSDLEAA